MKIFFENSQGIRKEIGLTNSAMEARKVISDFLNKHNYKSYYWRYSLDEKNHEIWIDVGSHSEFFIVTDFKELTMEAFING